MKINKIGLISGLIVSVSVFTCGCTSDTTKESNSTSKQEQLSYDEKMDLIYPFELTNDYGMTMGDLINVMTNGDESKMTTKSEGDNMIINITDTDGTKYKFVFDLSNNSIGLQNVYQNSHELVSDELDVFLLCIEDRCNPTEADDWVADDSETDSSESDDNSSVDVDINTVCSMVQDEMNKQTNDMTFTIKYNESSNTIIIDGFLSDVTRQDIEYTKDAIGTENYRTQLKNSLGNDGSQMLKGIQDDISNTFGFSPDIQIHLHAKDCMSLDLAFCTISNGWIVY